MKHAFKLATASMAAVFAVSAEATLVKTFDIDFGTGYTAGESPSGAVTGGTWSAGADNASYVNDSGKLVVDTPTNAPLTFAPSEATTSVIEMDVQFVGTSEEPLASRTGTQAALYLRRNGATTNLYLSVAGGSFSDTSISVNESAFYKVKLNFNYATGAKTVSLSVSDMNGNSVGVPFTVSSTTSSNHVAYVDFYGSGTVDKFVGGIEFDSKASEATGNDGSDSNPGNVTISGSTITTAFAATKDSTKKLNFIQVTDNDGNVRTLRITGNGTSSQAFNTTGLNGVSKIVAFYGDNVTATTGATPEISDATVNNGEVSGSVASAKSGLYYATVENVSGVVTTNSIIQPARAILPQEHGTNLTFTVTPATGDYSVKKFKVIAADSL